MLKRFFWLAVIFLSLFSCDNEVDLNDEYQEVTIVYGLLNPNENRHYVKIVKAFQSEGNVYISSSNPNNSEFAIPREVWLDEYINGSKTRTIALDTVIINDKDSGIFYYPTQTVYATAPNVFLVQNAEYKLFVKNKQTGKVISSVTNTIPNISILKPSSISQFISFDGLKQTLKWTSAAHGKLYQAKILFYYHSTLSGNTTNDVVEKYVGEFRSKTDNGGEECYIDLVNGTFFENLSLHIPAAKDGELRYFDSIQYVFDYANEDFTVYMDINKPSNSIVQERPTFTNIDGGLGIFGSRNSKTISFFKMSVRTQDSLVGGQYTKNLGFVKIIN